VRKDEKRAQSEAAIRRSSKIVLHGRHGKRKAGHPMKNTRPWNSSYNLSMQQIPFFYGHSRKKQNDLLVCGVSAAHLTVFPS
jgi:hypothetical protein